MYLLSYEICGITTTEKYKDDDYVKVAEYAEKLKSIADSVHVERVPDNGKN